MSAWIEEIETGRVITEGLQGCRVCDEALRAAVRIANDRGTAVLLHDDDGIWEIQPD